MFLRQMLTHFLALAIICASLPPAAPTAYAAHVAPASPSSLAAAKPHFTLRSNMRIAAAPQLAEFPGACTPRETSGATPDTTKQVWLPLVRNGGPAAAASTVETTQPARVHQPTIPLDPSLFATPLDEETSFAESIAFLYSGPNAVQTGVTAGAIDPEQAAVLRGAVLAQDGQPLPGVKIQIFGHTEYGQTVSRADGAYDMVVNAAQVTVCFELPGHLPTQRMVNAAWHDFTRLEDVVLLPMDDVVSTINLANSREMQVAQNRPTSDGDGHRQSTLLFEAGTGAQMVMADGATRPLSTLNVRATEYTVGENGPQAMPGELPLASGYTYAVDFTVDEALTAGAVDVQFDKPIINYVENFLDFPVGTPVPTGYYDRGRGAWVPSHNGRVIAILAINGGVAALDVDGSGQAASAEKLAELGIDEAEQRTLGELYSAGQSLWRVPIPHFTPWDHNWPYGPPDDATPPNSPYPRPDNPDDDPCERNGSIIECENQTLGESIDLVGAPFSLNYRSSRVPARELGNRVTIPVTGNSVPASLKNVILETSIAGQQNTQVFGPQPNQSIEFRWDGTDGYGRAVPQPRLLTVRMGYVYPAIYRTPGTEFQNSFARVGDAPITNSNVRQEITIWRTWRTRLQAQSWDARGQGLGGWTLDRHHFFDVAAGILYRGDGAQASGSLHGGVLRTVAGVALDVGNAIPLEDGAPASEVQIGAPIDIAAGPDGSFYFTSTSCVYKVDRQGLIHFAIASSGNRCVYPGDQPNRPKFLNPWGISLAPNGDLYVANHGNNGAGGEVVRIRPDGSVTSVAGNGQRAYTGDGGPATAAAFFGPTDVAVAPDGSFYVADFYNQVVRQVGTDGIITTVAGGGEPADGIGDGGPATAAKLGSVRSIAVDQSGVLYIGHDTLAGAGTRVRRVALDGTITTVVGGGTVLNQEDEMGTDTLLSIPLYALTVGPDNNLYLNDGFRIRRRGQDGRMTTVAGTTTFGYSEDGTPILDAKLAYPSIAFAPNGTLYLAEQNNLVVRTANLNGDNLSAEEAFVRSQTGAEIYIFDTAGRHLRTLNALTGAGIYTFGYDGAGQLITITDFDGNITTIERDGSGTPTAIVGPFGRRTTLTVNGDGYLTSVTAPGGAVHRMSYQDAQGLLTSFTDPNGNANQFSYDASGRLLQDRLANGGSWTLGQSSGSAGISVTVRSGLSRTLTLAAIDNGLGSTRRVTTFPDGATAEMTATVSGGYQVRYANGARVESRYTHAGDDLFNSQFESSLVQLPSGLQTQTSFGRARQYQTADDPLSGVAAMTSTTQINNATFTSIYDGATNTTADTSPAGRQAYLQEDAAGRVVEQAGFGLAPVTYGRNAQGLLTSVTIGAGPAARVYTLEYDARGELQALINPQNQRNELVVDDAGRVTSHTRPDGVVTTFAHDANGNMTSITPPGQPAHVFTYSAINQIASYTPPDVGNGSTTTSYSYNVDGQLTTLTRPDGAVVNVRYDAAGRPQSVALGRGAIQYGYDAATGQLNRITAPDGGELRYQHDGPLLTESQWSGAVAGTVQRGYDNFRRVNRLAVNGAPILYRTDADGMITQAGALALTYDANGLPNGSTLSNIATSTALNEFGELVSRSALHSGSALYDVAYTRDSVGRIVRKVETIGGVSTAYDYAYSTIGRLREVKRDGVVIATYTYDANGNRLSGPSGSGPSGATGVYDAQDRMLSYGSATYSYNAAGDLMSQNANGQITSYVYDELSNLTAVTLPDGRAISYVIDGNNRRIGKRINGVLSQGFLYQDQLRVVAELDGSNNVVSRFVYADSSNVPAYMVRSGVTYRLVSDHVGSVRLVVNAATGEIVQRLDYDAFGVVLTDSNPGFQPFGFAGGLYDADTGLTRFGQRDYDAATGRWTTKDPLGFAGWDTNLYLYAAGDPVNLKDAGGDALLTAIFTFAILSTVLFASLAAMPLAIKIMKKLQDMRNQSPYEFVGPPLPPQVCQQAPPPEPIPEPAPAPAPQPAPEPDPLPEEVPPTKPEPEPPVIDDAPDYMWANSEAPPPCPSPLIQPPVRGRLCK